MVMCRTPECAKAPVPTCSGRIWERLSRSRRTEGVNTWSTRVSLEVHSMRSSADRSTCCSWPATTKTTFAEPYADGRVFGTDKLTGHREGAIMNSWPATPSDGVPEEIDGVNVLQRSGLFESGTPVEPDLDRQFTKVVGFWAPRRWLTPETMDVDGMVGEIGEIIRTKGLVAYDGQVISSLRRVGPWEECFEPSSIDTPLDIPERRHWGYEQRAFFGVEQSYQMADDEGPFTYSSISTEIADPYLTPGELIAGVVHGSRERCYFTRPCHYAHVVYTTRHRPVCMSCGATHVVLREPC